MDMRNIDEIMTKINDYKDSFLSPKKVVSIEVAKILVEAIEMSVEDLEKVTDMLTSSRQQESSSLERIKTLKLKVETIADEDFAYKKELESLKSQLFIQRSTEKILLAKISELKCEKKFADRLDILI